VATRLALDTGDGVTCHVMVVVYDVAVRLDPPRPNYAQGQAIPHSPTLLADSGAVTPAPRLALDARDGVMPMHWAATFLIALAIAILAGVGIALIHYNFLWTDSLGIGMGVFVLVGAFMLYRLFFWHD
jgi:hypothetical protein